MCVGVCVYFVFLELQYRLVASGTYTYSVVAIMSGWLASHRFTYFPAMLEAAMDVLVLAATKEV